MAAKAPLLRSTTVLLVRRDGRVCMGSDGQVTLGDAVVKHSAAKVKRTSKGKVLVGFAGGGAEVSSDSGADQSGEPQGAAT